MFTYLLRHQVGFDDAGRIGSLKAELWCDAGWSGNEATSLFAVIHLQNVYKALGWDIKPGFDN